MKMNEVYARVEDMVANMDTLYVRIADMNWTLSLAMESSNEPTLRVLQEYMAKTLNDARELNLKARGLRDSLNATQEGANND